MRAAGPGFSTQGIVASVEHRLPRGNQIRVSYANGNALVMPASAAASVTMAQAAWSGPSASRRDLLDFALRHVGWNRYQVARELSLAA